ncbi:MAG TPA: hypothetical protein VK524_08565, partial [Polyangiaceae bacterium]|nr:hypothetical protein [Polyangiaceae bacterium]
MSTSADGGAGSLRAAIATANTHTNGETRIELPSGTYTLSNCGLADDTNATGDLDSLAGVPLTIAATGPDIVIRQTCAGERVLDHHGAGLLTLIDVKIEGGSLTSTGSSEAAQGGGVRVKGDAWLEGTSIASNSATSISDSSDASAAAHGGGLFVGGSLHAIASTFDSNTATAASGQSAEGGGAYVVGVVTLTASSFSHNRVVGGGNAPGWGRGGGLAQHSSSTGPVRTTAVQFTHNSAEGGMHVLDAGEGASATGGGLAVAGALIGHNLALADNIAVGATIPYSATLPGAASGAAISAAGSVTLTASTLARNRAVGGSAQGFCRYGWIGIPGGQIYPTGCLGGDGRGAEGAAIWSGGSASLSNATLVENVAV